MQNNTELLCLILEFQSRSLIVQSLLQAEATKEYKADWLKNADTVIRDGGGKFAKKGASVAQSVVDTTAILKQGFDLTGDMIQSLAKDPEFRKRAGIATGLPMAKLISNLATQANLNPKLTEKIDEWIATATKEFADQYGDDKSPMAQAIRNANLAQPPKDASFNEKMEFRFAQYAAYKEALESPEDFSKRDEIIGKAASAAIPIGISLAIALGFEVAIPLFMAQGLNWGTILSSVAIGEAADFAIQKGMDKLEINNPALRIGASMVAGILAGGLVTGISNKIAFNKKLNSNTSLGYHLSRIKEAEDKLRIDPKNFDGLYEKGWSLARIGKDEEAVKFLDKASKINPNDDDPFREKAESLARLGKYEEAVKSFDEALRIRPTLAHDWYNRGTYLAKLSKHEEAIESYNKAIEIRPYSFFIGKKASSLVAIGKHEEAIELFDEAIKSIKNEGNNIFLSNAKFMSEKIGVWEHEKKILLEKMSKIEHESNKLTQKEAANEIPKILDEAPQVVSKIPAFTRIDPMSLNKVGDLQLAIASLNKEWREKLGLFKGVSTQAQGNESQKITILRGRLKDLQDKIDLHIQNQS
jgi:tetratricopeptide (TPR) repeat protein